MAVFSHDSHFHILQVLSGSRHTVRCACSWEKISLTSERAVPGFAIRLWLMRRRMPLGDMEVVVLHQVVNGPDGTVRAVFDGQDPVLAKAFFNSIEYALKAVEIHDARHFKEFLAGSLRVGSWQRPGRQRLPFSGRASAFLSSASSMRSARSDLLAI